MRPEQSLKLSSYCSDNWPVTQLTSQTPTDGLLVARAAGLHHGGVDSLKMDIQTSASFILNNFSSVFTRRIVQHRLMLFLPHDLILKPGIYVTWHKEGTISKIQNSQENFSNFCPQLSIFCHKHHVHLGLYIIYSLYDCHCWLCCI